MSALRRPSFTWTLVGLTGPSDKGLGHCLSPRFTPSDDSASGDRGLAQTRPDAAGKPLHPHDLAEIALDQGQHSGRKLRQTNSHPHGGSRTLGRQVPRHEVAPRQGLQEAWQKARARIGQHLEDNGGSRHGGQGSIGIHGENSG